MTADQLLERSDLVVGGVVDAVDAESGNKVYQEEAAKGLADPNHQRSIDGAQVGP
ncbi:MAG: hypothetical protein WBW25_08525 [Halobacteriota archaeon]|jgi:hypothetical protein